MQHLTDATTHAMNVETLAYQLRVHISHDESRYKARELMQAIREELQDLRRALSAERKRARA